MYPTGPSAYDRAITVFSPDGRLFQVEYAREAVKRGTTAVGLVYDNGVLLAVDKNIISPLIVPESIEKIFQIDEHIAVATSGLVADARRLVESARIRAQQNRIAYNESISVSALTRELCDTKQMYTQYGGARPFGAALLIAGVDSKPHLFETDPSGAFTEYTTTTIGSGKTEADKFFEKEYKPGMKKDEAILLGLKALSIVSEGKIRKDSVDIITINTKDKYQNIPKDKIEEYIKQSKQSNAKK